jgi:Holliday junction resolvase RusA-like endonuclease
MTTATAAVDRLVIKVTGRPAPQGSKRLGEHGQMREQSAYLRPWRAAVVRAAYQAYADLGVQPNALPVLLGPVAVIAHFRMTPGSRVDGPPDIDKLLRSTFDALTQAGAWEDDSRVVEVTTSKLALVDDETPGALIVIWRVDL